MLESICGLLYSIFMQYIGQCRNVIHLPVASNDNEDLLYFPFPAVDLAFVRALKNDMRLQNSESGILLHSRKERLFFQEIIDAERYLLMRYFMYNVPEESIRELKRYILNTYLFPKPRKRKSAKKKP